MPVLDVEEIQPLSENLRLVLRFDTQALSGVQPSKALLQDWEELIIHWGLRTLETASVWSSRKTSTKLQARHPNNRVADEAKAALSFRRRCFPDEFSLRP
jgi:hypothetical protein